MRRLQRRRIRRVVVVLIDWRRRRVTIVRCTRVRTVVANSGTMKVSRHGYTCGGEGESATAEPRARS